MRQTWVWRTRTVATFCSLATPRPTASGVMTLLRGQVKKQLYLRDGMLVSADSNLREEALGTVLIALGLLPAERLNELLAEVKRRGQKMGRVLTNLGWVEPRRLLVALAEQVRGRRSAACAGPTARPPSTRPPPSWRAHRAPLRGGRPGVHRPARHLHAGPAGGDAGPGERPRVRLGHRSGQYRRRLRGRLGPRIADVLERGLEIAQLVLRPDASVLAYGLDALIVTNLTDLQAEKRRREEAFAGESTARDPAPVGLDALAELARSPTAAANPSPERANRDTGPASPSCPTT